MQETYLFSTSLSLFLAFDNHIQPWSLATHKEKKKKKKKERERKNKKKKLTFSFVNHSELMWVYVCAHRHSNKGL